MAWRVAKSLQVLLDEVNTIAPDRSKLSDGSIGDAAHVVSDHRPNAADVVCARDFTHDPGAGADMHGISRVIVETSPPALKYVIWDRKIWSRTRASEGWRYYGGSNPHTKHMHVSVGFGPDGRSTGPYDDTSPWGLLTTELPGGIMLPKYGDSGPEVRYWQRVLIAAGEKLPTYGTDGDYGNEMAAAVLAWYKRNGGDPAKFDGKTVTDWTAFSLQRKVFKGAKGDPGKDGRDGKDGVLDLPVSVEISGRLTQASE